MGARAFRQCGQCTDASRIISIGIWNLARLRVTLVMTHCSVRENLTGEQRVAGEFKSPSSHRKVQQDATRKIARQQHSLRFVPIESVLWSFLSRNTHEKVSWTVEKMRWRGPQMCEHKCKTPPTSVHWLNAQSVLLLHGNDIQEWMHNKVVQELGSLSRLASWWKQDDFTRVSSWVTNASPLLTTPIVSIGLAWLTLR